MWRIKPRATSRCSIRMRRESWSLPRSFAGCLVWVAAIIKAIDRVKSKTWFKDTEIWLYRGAWQEWEPGQIEMAVPLSPIELLRKRNAVFKHQSQKDRAMFPGNDEREFWQRAEA